MPKLINERALLAAASQALASARATYNPFDPTEIVVRHESGALWFTVPLPPGAIADPTRTIGVMVPGRGWLEVTPQLPTL